MFVSGTLIWSKPWEVNVEWNKIRNIWCLFIFLKVWGKKGFARGDFFLWRGKKMYLFIYSTVLILLYLVDLKVGCCAFFQWVINVQYAWKQSGIKSMKYLKQCDKTSSFGKMFVSLTCILNIKKAPQICILRNSALTHREVTMFWSTLAVWRHLATALLSLYYVYCKPQFGNLTVGKSCKWITLENKIKIKNFIWPQ